MNELDKTLADSFPASDPAPITAPTTVAMPSQIADQDLPFVHVYRVVPAAERAGVFSREANAADGRGTRPCTAAIHAARLPAGAMFEHRAHMDDAPAGPLARVRAGVRARNLAQPAPLPDHRHQTPHRSNVRSLDDEWMDACSELVQSPPSVLCESARNVLINPDHPGMGQRERVHTQAFTLDPRLVSSQKPAPSRMDAPRRR